MVDLMLTQQNWSLSPGGRAVLNHLTSGLNAPQGSNFAKTVLAKRESIHTPKNKNRSRKGIYHHSLLYNSESLFVKGVYILQSKKKGSQAGVFHNIEWIYYGIGRYSVFGGWKNVWKTAWK
jgi:hypothetical protein